MKQNSVLFQIKSIDKMICRNLIKDEDMEEFKSRRDNLHPTPTQMQIVEYILKHLDEEIYQKDLEDILNLRRATVSGVLQTMEKNNLISRVVDLKDTRTKKIILNEKAKKVFLEHKKRFKEIEKVVLSGISDEDLTTFCRVLNAMKDNLENHNIK